MNKVTDMIGQEVEIGDKIACAFRTYYGTAPQLRVGTVTDIVQRRSTERNGRPKGEDRPLEAHLQVVWTDDSTTAEQAIMSEDMNARRASRGMPPRTRVTPKYRTKRTDILVRLQRFLKIN